MLRPHGLAALFALCLLSLSAQAADSWQLRGRVLAGPQEERGHYEVGLFPVIGADGLPVGYPLSQEILPAGKRDFRLHIPARISRGYLFAELVEEGTGHRRWIIPTANPWTPASAQPAELYLRVDSVKTAPAASSEVLLRGRVATLFANPPIPQENVLVRVRGRKENTLTDAHGEFALALPAFRGQVGLEFLKEGFHPAVMQVAAGAQAILQVNLANRGAIGDLAQKLGVAQGSSSGALLGRALSESGAPLSGMTVQLSRESKGPFYFDDRGFPDMGLHATSSDGRFLFLNVQPGAAFLEAEIGGESVAPLRVSTADGGELLQKDIVPVSGTLSGRIFHAVKKGGPAPLAGARVRIEGTSEWTTSDSLGAFRLGPLKWSRGERVSLTFSAENFQNHRYQLAPGAVEHHLYAFPARYLAKLAESHEVGIDPASGVVVGRVAGPSVRVDALSDEAGPNLVKDFYFDGNGKMRPAPAMTDPRFGTFLLFNVPSGHAYLYGSDADGKLRAGREVFTGPSVVNVEVEN